MGWMHDTLDYMSKDPIYRRHHHGELTWTLSWAFSEQYALPLSHDEVVHGKGSLWGKMPGDDWQKAANLRLLYGHLFGHPGKKLLFMGGEFGQRGEWNHDTALAWDLLDDERHAGLMTWTADLNALYRAEPALWNDAADGFAWIDFDDRENCVVSYVRRPAEGAAADGGDVVVFVLNATPIPREGYRVGLPRGGAWRERLNSDAEIYGGSGQGNLGRVVCDEVPTHGHAHSAALTLPPLGVLVLTPEA
jgi:1,4-alpha-glucan branching enzyme